MKQPLWIKPLHTITLTNADHGRIHSLSCLWICVVKCCDLVHPLLWDVKHKTSVWWFFAWWFFRFMARLTWYFLMDWMTGLSLLGKNTSSSGAKQHRWRHWLRFLWWTTRWPHESRQKPPKLGRSGKRRPRQRRSAEWDRKLWQCFFCNQVGCPVLSP